MNKPHINTVRSSVRAMINFLKLNNIEISKFESQKKQIEKTFEILQIHTPIEKDARIIILCDLYKSGKLGKAKRPKKQVKKITSTDLKCFYDSIEWQWMKRKILRLYGTKCMKCKATKVEMHVDHIKPKSKYPELSMSPTNLQVLCRSCNLEKSNKNEIDYRTKDDLQKLSDFLS